SAAAFKEAVERLQENGADALLFDVRNNPGGYVTEVTEMLDYLLPEGKIFISRDINGKEEVFTSDAACINLPMVVLVNGQSYSAAELFAAELHESANAVIVGEQTCGKGYAQQMFPLANGGALGLSTLRYFTGSGISLIGTGLTPTTKVSLTEDESWLLRMDKLSHAEDPQLQAALSSF
ncbi:MAG: S41 family peptidase, partial [Evtepia sp.]